MEKSIQLLRNTLQGLIGSHRQLLDLVRVEHQAIVDADLKSLQEATYTKEAILSAVFSHEKKRQVCVTDLSVRLKMRPGETSLHELIIAIQGQYPKEADDLRSLWTTLRTLVERVTEQNKRNGALLEEALGHIAVMKRNVLGERGKTSATYTNRAKTSQPREVRQILSERA